MESKVQEVMDILQEECAEIIQMVSKIRRFGLDEIHFKSGESNRTLLTEEIGDLLAMVDLLQSFNIVTAADLEAAKQAKFAKLKIWTTIYEQD